MKNRPAQRHNLFDNAALHVIVHKVALRLVQRNKHAVEAVERGNFCHPLLVLLMEIKRADVGHDVVANFETQLPHLEHLQVLQDAEHRAAVQVNQTQALCRREEVLVVGSVQWKHQTQQLFIADREMTHVLLQSVLNN